MANDDFVKEVIQPVLDRMDEVADTNELFLRAQQLVRLCEVTPRRHTMRSQFASVRPESDGEVKIGEGDLPVPGLLTPGRDDRPLRRERVLHGHAHLGTYAAATEKGIPVYNCARSVANPSGAPYALIGI